MGIFIQTPNRENTYAMSHKINDIVFLRAFCGAHNAYWFIQRNKNEIICFPWLNKLAVNFYYISSNYLRAYLSTLAIDVHITLFNKAISVAPGANTAFANVFI